MLNAAVIGVGSMGKHHARVYSTLKGIKLVGVTDVNEKAGMEIAKQHKTKFYKSLNELISKEAPDIASVAVPTNYHKRVALELISKNISVLIEKPLAFNKTEANEIIKAAKKNKITLAVGHIERFNPAIVKLKELIEKGKFGNILSIVIKRVGIYPPRIKDVNVVTDIGVHDLDIVTNLVGKMPLAIYARGGKSLTEDREDHAEIMLDFGTFGSFIQVNWVTPIKIRTLSLTGTKAHAEVNYVTQNIELYKSIYKVKENLDYKGLVAEFGESKLETIKIQKDEPLKLEIMDFIKAYKNGTNPMVSGEDGLRAIRLAEAVNKSIQLNKTIKLHGNK